MVVAAKESGSISVLLWRILPRFLGASTLIAAGYFLVLSGYRSLPIAVNNNNNIINNSTSSVSVVSEMASATTSNDQVLVDFKKDDYRGFLLVQHEEHGLMLLRCTRKKNKPPHWQLPGGHVDEFEFQDAAKHPDNNDRDSQLLHAGLSGAARELFEETGLDLRTQLDRFQPADLHRTTTKGDNGDDKKLPNEYKHRLFYTVTVTDADFPKHGVGPLGSETIPLKLRLSVEHSGFTFQKDPAESAEMLQHHSGGKVSEAVCMFYQVVKNEKGTSTDSPAATSTPSRVPTRTPPSARRAKRDKQTPADIFPPPERKSGFCCFIC